MVPLKLNALNACLTTYASWDKNEDWKVYKLRGFKTVSPAPGRFVD